MEEDIKKFIEATAIWNCGEADIDSALISTSDVVKTHEPRTNFINDRGATKIDGLYRAEGVRRRKGEPRGTLWVLDCGDYRLVAFN